MAVGKIIKWLGPVLLIGGLMTGGCQNEPPQYLTATVTRGSVVQAVTASGTLNPVLNVQVGSQVSGIIKTLNADFNSPVKAGQVIAELDPATYKANLSSAEANLASVNANLELSKANARRDEELHKSKLLASFAYEQTIVTMQQAQAQVKVSEAAVERARVDLSRCTILAPVDGIVISRNVDIGQTVAASMSAPVLFVIANDLSRMQINTAVAEADVGGILVGQDVEFTVDAFMYETFRGKVTQIRNAPIVLNNVVTYDTIIEVSNPEMKLKPGMTANVSIILQRREDVLRVSNAAMRFRPPEVAAAAARTNAAPQALAQSAPNSAGERGAGDRGTGGGRRRGGGGGRGAGGGGGRPRPERAAVRTVYVMTQSEGKKAGDTQLKPTQIRVGISDGILTEIVEGLEGGETVVVGSTAPAPATTQLGGRPTNPLGGRGGGGGRGF